MAPLVITLDDTNYAIEQMEQSGPKVFGDRDWERQLTYLEVLERVPDDNSLWVHLYQNFRFMHGLAQKMGKPSPRPCRNLITYVYSTVYCARGFSLPLVTRADLEQVCASYRPSNTIEVAQRIKGDAVAVMAQVNKAWSVQFLDQADAVQVTPFQLHLACACILALLGKFGLVPFTELEEEENPMAGTEDDKESAPKKADPLAASGAPVLSPTTKKIKFEDIGGYEGIKTELKLLAKRFSQPSVTQHWGNDDPFGGVLLRGPKGTGKTTLVRAFASEVELPFYEFNLSDILKGYINHSHMQLMATFKAVREKGGVMCFNEADAMLVRRGSFNSHHEDEKLVNEWNNCMDLLGPEHRVIVFLTANFMEKMDEAALRDGRVNHVYTIGLPTDGERRDIFRARMTQMERNANRRLFKNNIRLDELVRKTEGMPGSAIRHIINRAADKKVDADLAGARPGPISTEDLMEALSARLVERDDRKKRPIGFRTTS